MVAAEELVAGMPAALQMTTVEMLASDIAPRDASKVMRVLARELPLPEELRHLKRIRRSTPALPPDTSAAVATVAKMGRNEQQQQQSKQQRKQKKKKNKQQSRATVRLQVLLCRATAADRQRLDQALGREQSLAPFGLRPAVVDVPRYRPETVEAKSVRAPIVWPRCVISCRTTHPPISW